MSQGIPKLLTVQEVAGYFHQKPATIRRWILNGELPGVKIGRHWLIIEDDLRDYMLARSKMLLAKLNFHNGIGRQTA